eukprot:CAMPEP_0114246448 /NCGR_PEP_ID=MMETSP0058-20121206/12466_1 /TAXON_ID=36894 /ORGANISM="Pyramimonas parkeae, CCMP726" /LENGTH=102 /DNA_ID=CAMNT_0001359631 /DNA_START=138 /DNA_END=445 /DNA_ORIENTATION=+
MGKSRAWRRSKDDQKMDTDEAPKGGAGVVSMEDDADVIDDGSKAGFGTVEGKASGAKGEAGHRAAQGEAAQGECGGQSPQPGGQDVKQDQQAGPQAGHEEGA